MLSAMQRAGMGDGEWWEPYWDAARATTAVLVPPVLASEIGFRTGQGIAAVIDAAGNLITVPPGENRDAYNPLFWGSWNLTNAATGLYEAGEGALQGARDALQPSGWSWTTIALVGLGLVAIIAVASKK